VSILDLQNVSITFGETVALNQVSLSLQDAEFLVILGPTGAGKTTLLRTIAGLQPADTGHIRIRGEKADHRSPSERDVAMVFQNFSLYPDRTVRQNLAFPLQSPGSTLSAEEIQSRIEWAADILHIKRLLDRPSTQLSGGEMQRVAIGRAIVRRPGIFLFDEPLTNLDAKLRESLRTELIDLQKQLGVPTVYVTHDQTEALSMADRIVVLANGSIRQTGFPSDVYEAPSTPEIAKQLGFPPINLLSARAGEGAWRSQTGDTLVPAHGDFAEATLGIRPENVATEGGTSPATVRIVEDTGASRILLVDWAGCSIRILASRADNHQPGDTIYPLLNPDRVMVWPVQ